ncbi:MAG: reverse transcriptase domain-containing protein [Patescibacteria group bacterium]
MHFNYWEFISIENLFQAWNEFKAGKRKKKDVIVFERFLETNLYNLHLVLKNKTYRHSVYQSFYVQDPKLRHIHKASVADRVVHHLLYKYLYEIFDKTFIYDSYSCRLEKGTHKGVLRLEKFTRIISNNYTKTCWALKLDIKKFFANVDHKILMKLLSQKINNSDILWLLENVINSFHSESGEGKGIPLGNLTSQVFANIYMNELDQFIKHELKIKYYLRYADDFLILSKDKQSLKGLTIPIGKFLKDSLKLELHPNKVTLRKLEWGIDFLGYNVLPRYILPRTKTKKRLFKKLKEKVRKANFEQSLQSYLGYLSHANSYQLTQKLKNEIWLEVW